ncbi:MAG: BspA family leucine-rich repeat surface protein [Crocinitomicaceae bacterium]|jgi:hypothetical protein|nr:BspA family leucine-rich repeat surface protein [Crocinitomicaceae bacterium]
MPNVRRHTNAAKSAFIIRIETSNTSAGSSAANQFKLPVYNGGSAQTRLHVQWGDGNHSYFNSLTEALSYTHTYQSGGAYEVKIWGRMPYFRFNNGGDRLKLIEVKQFGINPWRSMAGIFYGCENMVITATDTPNMLFVTDMSSAFRGCLLNNYSINGWNTSRVIDFKYAWRDNAIFNAPLNDIDVSKGQDFTGTFWGCPLFDQPLNNWQMSSALIIDYMFYLTGAFNQNLGSWDVRNVYSMKYTFASAAEFNNGGSPDINNWQTLVLKFATGTFQNARKFNQPLGNWYMNLVEDIISMFQGAWIFDQNLGNWQLLKVLKMRSTFQDALAFNNGGSPSINNWVFPLCDSLQQTFMGALSFNQPVGNWNVSNIVTLYRTFQGAISFNQNLNNWNVQLIVTMYETFYNATAYNQPMNNWSPLALTTADRFAANSSLSRADYDGLLTGCTGWNGVTATKTLQNNVSFGVGSTQYTLLSNAAAARSYLTNTKSWTITDGGGTM